MFVSAFVGGRYISRQTAVTGSGRGREDQSETIKGERSGLIGESANWATI